jgi:hypothetical protein
VKVSTLSAALVGPPWAFPGGSVSLYIVIHVLFFHKPALLVTTDTHGAAAWFMGDFFYNL